MKVLIIEPKYGYEVHPWLPIGKVCLASAIRYAGHEVKFIDNALNNYNIEQIISIVKNYEPDVVCTGGMTFQLQDAQNIAREIRKTFGDKIILVGGGVHLTIKPEDGLDYFDAIVVGEGETTIVELFEFYETKDKASTDELKNIDGIAYKNNRGDVEKTSPRELIQDLNSLPFPAYDLFPITDYGDSLITGEKAISVLTGRGCPYNCSFCASPVLTKRRVRYYSVDYTIKLIKYLIKNYGFKNFRIMDDTFALSQKRVMEFCDRIDLENLKLKMTCLTHTKTADVEMFKKMRSSGFTIVAFGVESANDLVLKNINKGISKQDAINAITDAKRSGLKVEALFMIGNQGETRDSIIETIKFAKKYNPPYKGLNRIGYNWFQFATPIPGSRFFEEARSFGKVISSNFDDYSHQSPVYIPEGLDAKTMIKLRNKALKATNMPYGKKSVNYVARVKNKIWHD